MAASILGLAWTATGAAHADESDGVYDRLSGDMLFVGAVGLAAERGGPALETHVGFSYLNTAGIYGRYVEAFGRPQMTSERSLALGLELRPLFLGRYALNLEQGPPHLDLFLDSFALLGGAVWSSVPELGFNETPGLEVGLAVEVPILPSANGPYFGVTGLARWRAQDLRHAAGDDLLARGSLLLITLAWHQVFDSGLVDVGDTRDSRR